VPGVELPGADQSPKYDDVKPLSTVEKKPRLDRYLTRRDVTRG